MPLAQESYNAGRWRQMTEPPVLRARPFWMYDAILDSRTTPICRERDGKIYLASDAWWQSNYPPLHFRCRSGVRTLSKDEAEEFGGVTAGRPESEAQQGFGLAPDRGEWQPAPDRWPGPLQAMYAGRYDGRVLPGSGDFELIEGEHYGPVRGELSDRRRKRILRSADALRIDGFMKAHSLGPVDFIADLEAEGLLITGRYFWDEVPPRVALNSNRASDTFGFGFLPRLLPRVSYAAETRDRAIGRSFVHELGHHLYRRGLAAAQLDLVASAYSEAERAGSFVSMYAREGGEAEYFCECLSAYRFHREDFEAIDPAGYNMVEKILREIRGRFSGS